MAVLPILLYPPSDLNGGNRFDGFCAQILDDALCGCATLGDESKATKNFKQSDN